MFKQWHCDLSSDVKSLKANQQEKNPYFLTKKRLRFGSRLDIRIYRQSQEKNVMVY